MPIYFYKAKNLEAEEEAGILDAKNPSELAKTLRKKKYFLTYVKEEKEEKKGILSFNLDFFDRFFNVPLTEKLFFTKNLRVMIKTGISLPRAFKILSRQAKNNKFKKALKEISEKISKGKSLSESLGFFPAIFSDLYKETLKVGEETGSLEESLEILDNQMQREHDLKSKVKSAMAYPMIVLIMTILIGVFMMIFAVPNLKIAFEELNVQLPLTTKMILSSADFLMENWIGFGFFIFILILALTSYFRTRKGQKTKSNLLLKIPVFSKITKETNSSLALVILSSLLKAGVPVVRSLEITSGALSNFYFKESLINASKVVEKGGRISESLRPYENLYSPMVLEMMEIGEETGETSEILKGLADFYEEEVTNSLDKLSSIIEPILILGIGLVVGFFAISMLQPIFNISKGL
jgi:type IV pilus assembly protein PilC